MGKKLKGALAGLGAGLQTFGHEYGKAKQVEAAQKQQQLENEQTAERMTETKRMNDSLLKQRDMQMKQTEFTNNLKKAAFKQNKIAEVVAAAGYAPDGPGVDAFNKWHPSGVVWQYDKAKSAPNEIHMMRGHWEKDSATGDDKIGADGKKIFKQFAGKSGHWAGTDKDWVGQFNKVMDPTHGQAAQVKQDHLDREISHASELHKLKMKHDPEYQAWYESTPRGQREAENLELRNAKLKRESEGKTGKPPAAQFTDSSGNTYALTSQEVEVAKANRRSLEDAGMEGVSVEQAWRISNIQDDTTSMRVLDKQLRGVLKETISPTEFLKLHKSMKVPRAFLQNLLDDAQENPDMYLDQEDGPGGQARSGSGGLLNWFKNAFKSSPETENTGVMF